MKKYSTLLVIFISSFASAASQPNILFILTDDQGYGDLSCNGHPFVKTPHMDKIREESVRFENFHVAPSCSPTRAGILAGMHEFKAGVTHTKAGPRQQLALDRKNIAELLQENGYHTVLNEKWHLFSPPPYKRGFDSYLLGKSAGPRETHMYWDPVVMLNNEPTGEAVKGFTPDIMTDQVIDFLQKHNETESDQPFCYFYWTVSPHAPVMAPEKYIKKFKGKMTENEAKYCAMVENLDDNVGRIMASLKEHDLDKDTLVVLMNDNGSTVGLELHNAGMRGAKTSVWPGGTRAFSYWRWPGVFEPRTEEALTGYIDIFPTFMELAGAEIPAAVAANLDGYSMVDLLKSKDGDFPRDRLLFKHGARWESGFAAKHKYIQAGVHKGDHLAIRIDVGTCKEGHCVRGRKVKSGKATSMVYTSAKESTEFHWAVTEGWELYNVKADPACKKNLAETQTELLGQLSGAYDTWWDEVFPQLMERGGDEPLLSTEKH